MAVMTPFYRPLSLDKPKQQWWCYKQMIIFLDHQVES